MEAENRWGNTKFLLGQLVPGKEQPGIQGTKGYVDCCELLGLDSLLPNATEVDEILALSRTGPIQKAKHSNDSARAAGGKPSGGSSGRDRPSKEMRQVFKKKDGATRIAMAV